VSSTPAPFGQNEWLVEEMYRKFREDPSSVDPSWHEFLVDYSPEPAVDASASTSDGQPAEPAAPPEPKPTPAKELADK
jgi:2-oxoglutarate decarboxylase